ncbi:hypothetical protein RG963_10555 [Methanosarcina sp. Z-7115]|uniref:Cell surface protein n=1 Tax=Methanosarcina baikalica TaxID=3073890 RepID=A0ABU2D2Y0_9EURY|nr:hypothetical protein [Methanosarcina sp. Z-7115]MDR7666207.1 hypothetical protein [Methanosarcina sp. Z-7115]
MKVKLKGKRKQKVRFALSKTKLFETSTGQRRHITSISENLKGNSKREFDLESDASYSFVVQPDPFIPFIVEFSTIEYRSHSDQLFQFGLALFISGLVIYFAK